MEKYFKEKKEELATNGLTILPDIFPLEVIERTRSQILEHYSLLLNTRPTASSRHLAGFHRYPEFENLHSLISCNPTILSFLKYVLNGQRIRNTGISDITVNRSQCWHKDLLRGPYQSFLDYDEVWKSEGEIFRIVLYLQDSTKLKIVPGSHLEPISLESDYYAIPVNEDNVMAVPVKAGSVVIMDVRTTHRGGYEHDFEKINGNDSLSILVATTLGLDSSTFTAQLEYGNAYRLKKWMERNSV